MRVAVDAQLTLGTATGIGAYARGLLAAFAALEFPATALIEPRLNPWRFDRRVAWDQALLPLFARDYDLLHCTAGTAPVVRRRPYVVTVHDVAWLRVQRHARAYARAYFGGLMLAAYRRAARIVVVSEFARAELLAFVEYPPERVDVIYNGVDAAFFGLASDAVPDGPPVILCPGTVERRKNLGLLIRAVAASGVRDARIHAPGPHTPYARECAEIAASCGMGERLEMPGYVDDARLRAAYARATMVAVPSRYEGFGYAAAQALCAGVPVVVPTGGALAEIVGADGATIPGDVDAWAQTIAEYCRDPSRPRARAKAAAPGAARRFSWETAARATIAAYRAA